MKHKLPIAVSCSDSVVFQKVATGVFVTIVAGGVVLSALEQLAYRVFTSNSRAAVEFAKGHPESWIVGSANNGNIARVYSILDRDPILADRFGYLSETPLPKEARAPNTRVTAKGLPHSIGRPWGGVRARFS